MPITMVWASTSNTRHYIRHQLTEAVHAQQRGQATFLGLPIDIQSEAESKSIGHNTHWQNSMVCVEESIGGDLPCLIPRDILFVDKDTHQLRDCKSWMGLYTI